MCPPKCALCCLLLGIWGFVQLIVMGILYYFKAVPLFEDLGVEEFTNFSDLKQFYDYVDLQYEHAAYNCWIAALIYFIVVSYSAARFHEAAHEAMQD